MRKYWTSNYAINKNREGIVYQFVDGGEIEITLEEYLLANPDKTEQDFIEIKNLSDEIYYQQDKQEQRTSRLDVSLNGLEETNKLAVPSIDAELIQKGEEEEALQAAYRFLHSGKLTEVQQRRFIWHYFQGLSSRQIAKLEGVHQRAVWDSLMWAEKKFKKFFKE